MMQRFGHVLILPSLQKQRETKNDLQQGVCVPPALTLKTYNIMNNEPNRNESMANATAMMYLAFFKNPNIHLTLSNYTSCIHLTFFFDYGHESEMAELWECLEKGALPNARYSETDLKNTECYSAEWIWIF